ncbi:MAG: hypothetical protein COA74_09960 [Gammaproteobacteria bacterium]|nr:MAG: hypothetical protein COA74_09960 [Gammaproteobacteria bacterium]
MSDDNNWKDMMSQWQSCKIAKVDANTGLENIRLLEKKTRRKARSMKCFMWGDIIGLIIFALIFIYQLVSDKENLYLQVLLGGALIIIIPMTFLSVWYRKGAWSTTGNDTRAYLTLALRRSISAIKLAKATAIMAIVAGIFFVSLILWKASLEEAELLWPWNRYIFGISFQIGLFTAVYFGSRWYEKRRMYEKIKLEALLEELDTAI